MVGSISVMGDTQQLVPTIPEIEQQLRRVLASKVFSSRRKPSQLLELLVKKALANKTVEPKDILILFPPEDYEPDTTAARTNAVYMRRLLAEYYDGVGKDDPVVIKFPKDTSLDQARKRTANYRPTFSYGPNHGLHKTYLIGTEHQRRKRPTAFDRASACFAEVLAKQPNNVAANIAMAETLLLSRHILQHDMDCEFDAHDCASRAVDADPRNWKAYAVLGASHLIVRFNARDALEAFETALNFNSHETERCGWFHAFLFAEYRDEEGLALSKITAEENITDPYMQAMYGMWLYANADYHEADKQFCDACQLDRNCWLAHLGSTLNDISLGNPELAANKLRAFQSPVDDFRWWADGLVLLCKRYSDLSLSYGWKPGEGSIVPFSYPILYQDESTIWYRGQEDPAWVTLQLALSSMARLEFDRAVDFLQEALVQREAWTIWMHLLTPLFMPIIHNDRFQQLFSKPPYRDSCWDDSSNSI
jgi:hypothetical protein